MIFTEEEKAKLRARPAFVIYKDRLLDIEFLDNEEKAALLEMIVDYQCRGVPEEEIIPSTPAVALIFKHIMDGFHIAEKGYLKTSKMNSEKGKKGGRPRKEDQEEQPYTARQYLADHPPEIVTDENGYDIYNG